MFQIEVLSEYCKGCELCVAACPKELLTLSESFNAQGVHFAVCTNNELCTGCRACAVICPDAAIRIVRTDAKDDTAAAAGPAAAKSS